MKDVLRREVLARRAALSAEERRRQSRAITQRLEQLPVVRGAKTIVGYHPTPTEVDDLEFLQALSARGHRVLLPRIDGDELSLHEWHPGDSMERSLFRILEPMRNAPAVAPASAHLVLVPGVAFDRRGHRLGYGRAFYDRLLSRVPRSIRVGLAFDVQIVDELPVEPHDVPLGWLVTAQNTLQWGET